MIKVRVWACVLLAPTACATPGGGGFGIVALDPNHHVAGAEPLVGTRQENCDAASIMAVFAPIPASSDGLEKVSGCERMRRSMAWALRVHPATGAAYSKEGRNDAVGLLLAESDRKCLEYTQFIEQYNSNISTGLGLLSHAASTAAAIATGGLATALATGASITTDASGQLAKGHFADKAIPVVVAAYQAARAKIHKEISDGMTKDTAAYDLGAAVGDVFRYHSQCSVNAGLDAADDAVREKARENGSGATGGATTTTTKGAPNGDTTTATQGERRAANR